MTPKHLKLGGLQRPYWMSSMHLRSHRPRIIHWSVHDGHVRMAGHDQPKLPTEIYTCSLSDSPMLLYGIFTNIYWINCALLGCQQQERQCHPDHLNKKSERLSTVGHCGQAGLLQTRTACIVRRLGIEQGQLVSACPGISGHASNTMGGGPSYF